MIRQDLRRIGRIIQAACPPGTGYAALIDGAYMASVERRDVARALGDWLLRRGPLWALSVESLADRHIRLRLEAQCGAIAGAVAETFAAHGKPVTMAFFLFELGPPGLPMAWRIIGCEADALGWVTAIAQLAPSN